VIKKAKVLGTHLFVKVPRPGDSEVTFSVFESSYQCKMSTQHLNYTTVDCGSEISVLEVH